MFLWRGKDKALSSMQPLHAQGFVSCRNPAAVRLRAFGSHLNEDAPFINCSEGCSWLDPELTSGALRQCVWLRDCRPKGTIHKAATPQG